MKSVTRELGFPVIVRASFTLGGTGGGIAYHLDELRDHLAGSVSDTKSMPQRLVEEPQRALTAEDTESPLLRGR